MSRDELGTKVKLNLLDLKLSSQIYNIFALALSKNIFVKNIQHNFTLYNLQWLVLNFKPLQDLKQGLCGFRLQIGHNV